ncbi:MAG: glutamate racemase [Gammaproteobacteria bacterium]|nr:MAG: glutamate racemase [Gammaproteobacteria bacterium]
MSVNNLPIGVFDSGVGGLTVLNSIRKHLPYEKLLYLGDTARVPYGTKSKESVIRYAVQATQSLVEEGVKMIVIACNTASSVALPELRRVFSNIPVIGVVEPGARASCEISENGNIGVIGTEGTINGMAYQEAIARIRKESTVIAKPCSLFVALAEEGLSSGPIVNETIKYYLTEDITANIDCLVLGCTHFPVLANSIQKFVGDRVKIIDSAETTAKEVKKIITDLNIVRSDRKDKQPDFRVTDGPKRFARVAGLFGDFTISADDVVLVDI